MTAIQTGDSEARRLLGGGLDHEELLLRARMLQAAPTATSVIQAISRANTRLPKSSARAQALERLRSGAVVVCAGQQPGLLGGPLMALVKAAAAVRTARTLTSSGIEAVPIFWIASEDHDFKEVNRFFLRPDDQRPDGGWFHLPERPRADSLHDLKMTAEDVAQIRALTETEGLPDGLVPHPGEAFGDWFARLMAELTSTSGLLIVQPIDFAAELVPLRRMLLDRHEELAEVMSLATEELAAADFSTPLSPYSSDSTFMFLATDEGRCRLDQPAAERYQAGSQVLSPSDLDEMLSTEPSRFSSAAAARPLAQQALLPVVAQISGPTEGAYMAQLMPLFTALGLPRPLIRPRPQLTVIDASLREKISRAQLEGPPSTWTIEAEPEDDAGFDEILAGLRQALAGVENHRDPFLRTELVSYRREMTRVLLSLRKSWQRDLKKRNRDQARLRHQIGLDLRLGQGGQDRVVAPAAIGITTAADFARIVDALPDDGLGTIHLEVEEST